MKQFLKSVFNILIGLVALIYVYALKLFFLITAVGAIIIIGYSFVKAWSFMFFSHDAGIYLSKLATTALFSLGYLYLTNLMGVGMHDIVELVNVILKLKDKSVANQNGNSRLGEKGVFKNE